jgi:hypothetical protein
MIVYSHPRRVDFFVFIHISLVFLGAIDALFFCRWQRRLLRRALLGLHRGHWLPGRHPVLRKKRPTPSTPERTEKFGYSFWKLQLLYTFLYEHFQICFAKTLAQFWLHIYKSPNAQNKNKAFFCHNTSKSLATWTVAMRRGRCRYVVLLK